MDVDQAARSNAQEYFGVKDPDYYEFEGAFTFIDYLILQFKSIQYFQQETIFPFTNFQHTYLLMMAWKKTKVKTDNATDL